MEDLELQRQAVCALNCVLYEQLHYKGNEFDYDNPRNSYIHQVGTSPSALHVPTGSGRFGVFFIDVPCAVQVLRRHIGIPISLSVLYMTLARRLGVQLQPVNFPSHFLLRWRQKPTGYVILVALRSHVHCRGS